jgi:hypothetical protein
MGNTIVYHYTKDMLALNVLASAVQFPKRKNVGRIPVKQPTHRLPTKPLTLYKKLNKQVRNVQTKATFADAFIQGSEVIGQGIIVYVMFYCSMNWVFYRGLRKDKERSHKKDD